VDRTSRLVQQLLDLSREEAEAESFAGRWVSSRPRHGSCGHEFAPLLQRKHIELRLGLGIEAAEVQIDEAGLTLCLRNLVGNAIEHAPDGSRIEIAIEDQGSWVEVQIADEGSGIPQSELENIKQRFVRGSRARGPGSGLGLSIVELVLERAGAELQLVNRAPSGLAAVMRFPAAAVRLNGTPSQR